MSSCTSTKRFFLLFCQLVFCSLSRALIDTNALQSPNIPAKFFIRLRSRKVERWNRGKVILGGNIHSEDGGNNVKGNDIKSSKYQNKNLGRRKLLLSGCVSILPMLCITSDAFAGIDVSGLRVEGSNNSLSEQLRSASAFPSTEKTTMIQQNPVMSSMNPSDPTIATYAPIFSDPRLSKSLGPNATPLTRYDGQLVGPPDSKAKVLDISFQFPFDWLQLDKVLGGIQFVDQRNGDKLYILRAKLPEDSTLDTVNKQWFGASIFDPKGSISSGINIDEFKVSSSSASNQIVNCPTGACSIARRRVKMSYATVTGNGLRVERRALVDAYEVENWCYMLMTSSNAVNFEKKGRERDTVEAIVDSFRLER